MFLGAHKQGEHVAIVGPSGGGKTTLGLELCQLVGSRKGRDRRPSRVVVLGTKPRDDTLSRMVKAGWPIIKQWPPAYGEEHCIVWPRGRGASTAASRHRNVFLPLMDAIYDEGGQTVCVDEAAYFERQPPAGLGMGATMEQFWSAARSNRITMIGGTQRPRNVTRLMWSEPSWIIIFTPEDEDDLKRVAELSGRKPAVLEIVPQLGGFEFLCVRRQRSGGRGLYVSKVQRKPRR